MQTPRTAQLRDSDADATVSAAVYRQLRADVVACRLLPSTRLRVEALRQRYGVGASPLREALMRLEAEGLVLLEQNKGFRVSPASKAQLLDLMRTRIEIESLALRWSIERGGLEWEAELVASYHRLSKQKKFSAANRSEVNPSWFTEHRDFHYALVAACGSPTLLAIRNGLFDQAERYVALSIVSRIRPRDDGDEHAQIMRAALARNEARAVQLIAAHIERTTERVAKSLEQRNVILALKAAGQS